MKASRIIVVVGILLLAGGGAAWWARGGGAEAPAWRTVELERKDVRSVVSATGAVEAVQTVEVGTQVSGIVAEVLVDYNQRVQAGEVLARIDTALLSADVAAAEARLQAARAAERRTGLDLGRMRALREKDAASDQELQLAEADHSVDAAEVASAEVALARARRNLGYATITAPIAGIVVKREVDPGQTVNAGFSAPTLFVLAGDLDHLQVLAHVDEADIGKIADGLPVDITVQAHPGATFAGRVEQVRLLSTIQENVVTYPVVVAVQNAEGKLRPGMTATLEFVLAEAEGVLCAPNAALRFNPDSTGSADKGGTASGGGGRPKGEGDNRGDGGGKPEPAVWTVGADGAPVRHAVTVGLRGSTCAEISGEGLEEGAQLVVGVDRAAGGTSSSPFGGKSATSGTQGPPGMRGGGF